MTAPHSDYDPSVPSSACTPARYVKRPIPVEAVQLTLGNSGVVLAWLEEHGSVGLLVEDQGIRVDTLEGSMLARYGDYVLRGIEGEFYPCARQIFEHSYIPAPEAPAGSPTLQAFLDRKGEADTPVTEEVDTPVAHWDPETASEIAALVASTLLLGAAKVQSSGHPAAARNYLEAIAELVMFGPPATERRA